MIEQLPEECIREILLRLDRTDDIERAGNACTTMSNITKEKRIWRELVQTHFSRAQIEYVVHQKPHLKEQQNYQEIYKRLRRRFGLRETYTEMLSLCRRCQALFWTSIGHPCFVPEYSDCSSDSSGAEDVSEGSEHYVPVTFK